MSVETLACSATESTRGSEDVKKGFRAFRYLKLGKVTKLDSSGTPLAIIINELIRITEKRSTNPFLVLFFSPLIFCIKIQLTKNKVGSINTKPPIPKTKCGPGLSNEPEVKRNIPTNSGIDHSRNLCSLFTKGSAKTNIPIGIIKN